MLWEAASRCRRHLLPVSSSQSPDDDQSQHATPTGITSSSASSTPSMRKSPKRIHAAFNNYAIVPVMAISMLFVYLISDVIQR
jgi:hypothetical protein